MGVAKAKDSVEGKMLFTLSFFMSKAKSHIRHLDNLLLQCRCKGGRVYMREKKYYLAIDDYERSVIINSLNNLRNKLIADGRYTDAVDELIIKFAHAPIKKFRIKMTEV
jgi:hypothetical protein